MNNKLIRLFILCSVIFSYIPTMAGVKKDLAKMKAERAEFLDQIKKAAKGDSTVAYRVLIEKCSPQLAVFDQNIKNLEAIKKLKSKL